MTRGTGMTPAHAALRKIIATRDYHAEHGRYPVGTVKEDQSFDDWAADLAEEVLRTDSLSVDRRRIFEQQSVPYPNDRRKR